MTSEYKVCIAYPVDALALEEKMNEAAQEGFGLASFAAGAGSGQTAFIVAVMERVQS